MWIGWPDTGKAFCNRYKERDNLKHHFENNQHIMLYGSRRYGKSSLIKQVMEDTGLPGRRIDLLSTTNIYFVQKAIKICVSELLNEIVPITKKTKTKLFEFIAKLHPKLTINVLGQQFEISSNARPEISITEMLITLNTVAEKLKKRVVICLDEFQQISLLKNHHSIEASIRHAAESSTYLTYVFSGSSRHLLSQMFNSKSRPLYKLCDLIKLERIEEDVYLDILYERAVAQWGKNVEKNIIQEILTLTKCHSYYVNALCRLIWKNKKILHFLVYKNRG